MQRRKKKFKVQKKRKEREKKTKVDVKRGWKLWKQKATNNVNKKEILRINLIVKIEGERKKFTRRKGKMLFEIEKFIVKEVN